MIMKKDDFRANDGWLDKFKKSFGICFLTIMGEKLSCDISAVLYPTPRINVVSNSGPGWQGERSPWESMRGILMTAT
jgi:hypothetical protein